MVLQPACGLRCSQPIVVHLQTIPPREYIGDCTQREAHSNTDACQKPLGEGPQDYATSVHSFLQVKCSRITNGSERYLSCFGWAPPPPLGGTEGPRALGTLASGPLQEAQRRGGASPPAPPAQPTRRPVAWRPRRHLCLHGSAPGEGCWCRCRRCRPQQQWQLQAAAAAGRAPRRSAVCAPWGRRPPALPQDLPP